jgi:phytoene dehydrogenase-like protein
MTEVFDAVIVGAGLAGLAAARQLHAAGHRVGVFEASDGVGGRVRTDVIDGFRCDRGFQVALTGYPELARQLDVEALRLCRFEPGAAVWIDGRQHIVSDPLRRPASLPATLRAGVGSLPDKLRLARSRVRWWRTPVTSMLRGDDRVTIAALASEGYSERFVGQFFRPLLGGIQLDPDLSGSSRMSETIMKMLSTGDAAVPAMGMQAIPDQMAAGLAPGSVRLNRAVERVEPGAVWLAGGERVEAASVIVATEGPAAQSLLGLRTVESKPVSCAYFATRRAPSAERLIMLNGSGKGPILNVAVISNVAPSYAPEGWHLIVAAAPGLDAEVADDARRLLREWWGSDVDDWRHLASYRIEHGQPDDRPPFSPKRKVDLGDGLFVCGDHRDTPSIQGALFSGRRCGEAVASMLAARAQLSGRPRM